MRGYINQQTIKKTAKQTDLQRIYKLDFSIMNIEKIQQLQLVPKLRCLILSFNRITVIQSLRAVPDLRQLHLECNLLRKITGLESSKNLTVLNLAGNKIQKIQGMQALARLETLNLQNNKLTRMGNIDCLRDLKNLNLSHNQIEVVEFIPAFSKLELIDFSHNKIKAILPDFFNNCPKLIKLNLQNNLIKHTEFLAPLVNLQYLNLSCNQISVFQPEKVYEFLQQLDLSSNEIDELPYFPVNFPELMILRLSNNFITNEVTLLQAIAGAESLVELDFIGNPMYNQGFEEAIQKVHKLEIINGKIIEEAGSKYKQAIDNIIKQFRQAPEVYLKDDSEDLAIKNSGFYSQDLQLELTGVRPNRPPSPQRKIKLSEREFEQNCKTIKSDIQRNFKRGKEIRNQCLEIWKRLGYGSPPQQLEVVQETPKQQGYIGALSERKLEEIKLENQRKLEKWRQLKAKQKSFNIRELSKKKKGSISQRQEQNVTNGSVQLNSLPKFTRKTQKLDLLMKTQMSPFDQKLINEATLARTQQRQFRPQSLKK